jgi:hypothetical protein
MDVLLFRVGSVERRPPSAVAEKGWPVGFATLLAPASVCSEKTSLVLFRVCSGEVLRRAEPIAASCA